MTILAVLHRVARVNVVQLDFVKVFRQSQCSIDSEVLEMDAAAFALARDAKLPIIVFSIKTAGAISAAIADPSRGTIVTA